MDFKILRYNSRLKMVARRLRSGMTDTESKLWSRLRRRQLCNVQFYRQRSIGQYIVDFYAPKAKLVVEVDGSQHLEPRGASADAIRNRFLTEQGLHVLHFHNLQILNELDAVTAGIHLAIIQHMGNP
ncbi:MAG: endonuclease domain-containing protein [Gammaproteobacteria bacterium]